MQRIPTKRQNKKHSASYTRWKNEFMFDTAGRKAASGTSEKNLLAKIFGVVENKLKIKLKKKGK